MRLQLLAGSMLALCMAAPAVAEDEPGCSDHPLFTRFPQMRLSGCEKLQFDMRGFPTGKPDADHNTRTVEVEGAVTWLAYDLIEGSPTPSGLQIMRNFENAARKAGATIEGQYTGWCPANYDPAKMPRMGNGCLSYGLTMRFARGDKETWAFLQASEREGSYLLTIVEREAMKQDVAASEIADTLARDGFVALYVNFDTGKSTIKPDSARTLDDAAGALKLQAALRIEVGGHTDNVGAPEANLKLSQERAQAVMAALVQRGIDAGRMTAKGYGQTVPVADNRTEEGRAKNRRVELTRK
ncbi:MAG TPA: OmpA family protein, partial [Anaeromyxobacteraceae bacterium]|nr:OmpA family protein [Anaeromyxobacteraceae bacterium]